MGLLNPYTGCYSDPRTGDVMSIEGAVSSGAISGSSVYVTNPISGLSYTLSDAIAKHLVDPNTGELPL